MRKFTFNHAAVYLFFVNLIHIFMELLIISVPNKEVLKISFIIWMAIYFWFIQDAFVRTYNPITLNYLLSQGVKRKDLLKGLYASHFYIFIFQVVSTLLLSVSVLDKSYILDKLILVVGLTVASLWGLGWFRKLRTLPLLLVVILASVNIYIMLMVVGISAGFMIQLLQRRFMEESLI